MGAVAMSPVGGLRQRLVLGPAVREKYSMHCGSENVDGRFRGVNEEPSGGILAILVFYFLVACLLYSEIEVRESADV